MATAPCRYHRREPNRVDDAVQDPAKEDESMVAWDGVTRNHVWRAIGECDQLRPNASF